MKRDGDKDGFINDGTPYQRPVPGRLGGVQWYKRYGGKPKPPNQSEFRTDPGQKKDRFEQGRRIDGSVAWYKRDRDAAYEQEREVSGGHPEDPVERFAREKKEKAAMEAHREGRGHDKEICPLCRGDLFAGIDKARKPKDGDGDGMYSPRPGMPDKTPVPRTGWYQRPRGDEGFYGVGDPRRPEPYEPDLTGLSASEKKRLRDEQRKSFAERFEARTAPRAIPDYMRRRRQDIKPGENLKAVRRNGPMSTRARRVVERELERKRRSGD